MKKELQSATTQFKKNDSLDRIPTEELLKLHKQLYEKSKLEFFKTCPICYEISSIDSFCNCKTLLNNGIEIEQINRSYLKDFIVIYENTEGSLTAFKELIELLKDDNTITKVDEERNKKADLNSPAIISVQQFMKEEGYVSIHKTVRKNQEGLPYLTFIKVDNVAHNIYFSKEAGQDKQAGQLLYKGFFDKLNVAEVTNADGEIRLKIVDESFDFSKANEIAIFDQTKEIEEIAIEVKTIEQTEIKFIKVLFLTILIYGLILFSSITVIVGTFFKNTIFRKILLFLDSNSISYEDKIMSGAFTISVIVLILMFFLSNIGSNTKSEVLKKAINSPRATHIHILIVVLLFGGVFWQASAMILIGISIISSIVLVILVISKMKEKIKKKDEPKNLISKSF
jgi:hypothetical protein